MPCNKTCFEPRYPLSEPTARPFAAYAEPNGKPFSPQEMLQSYGIREDSDAGAGITVAFVAAYGYPSLQEDFDEFNRLFGLPAAKIDMFYTADGENNAAQTASRRQVPEAWRLEAGADASWLHAAAPGAQITAVFAPNASISALMQAALVAAQKADIVSMSFGSAEFREQTAFDTSLAESGKCFVASSGDTGGAVLYPSASAAVLSVGGAVFHRNPTNGRVVNYAAWENGGGGPSLYTGIPNWQQRFQPIAVKSGQRRATPDVALDACQGPGYAVFDGASKRLRGVCGTSIGAPVFAGMLARHMARRGGHASGADVAKALYTLAGGTFYQRETAAASYYDVILGSNGRYAAGVGYDFCTGLGVPLAGNREFL